MKLASLDKLRACQPLGGSGLKHSSCFTIVNNVAHINIPGTLLHASCAHLRPHSPDYARFANSLSLALGLRFVSLLVPLMLIMFGD